MSAFLTVESLSKRIADLRILDGIDATVEEGSVTAFIGPNGAGKTSLFHAITGNMQVDTGRVFLAGTDVTGTPSWKVAQMGVGRVFQDVRVFPHLTPVENVIAALHGRRDVGIRGMFRRRAMETRWEERAREILDDVGVEGELEGPSKDLSFGNEKLLAFARLIAGDFRVALLDEPTAGVSPSMVARLTGVIRRLAKEQGRAVAVIEHDMPFISHIADRAYVLQEGRVFDSGEAREVLSKPAVRELCLGL